MSLSDRDTDTIPDPQQPKLLRVCRIGRAQGLKGEVNVFAVTDEPERRFTPGSVLTSEDGERSFRVKSSRRFKHRWIVHFEGVEDRNASEALNGIELYAPADLEQAQDEEGWYIEDLVGLQVRLAANNALALPAGQLVGSVKEVIDSPAQQLLSVALEGPGSEAGETCLIPFVEPIVPSVDSEAGFIDIDPPKGLIPGLS